MFRRFALSAVRTAARRFGATAARVTATRVAPRMVTATKNNAAYGAAAAAVMGAAFAFKQRSEPLTVSAASVPPHGVPGTKHERTFIAIKPDGVQRGLVSEIIKRFEQKGFKLVAMRLVTPSKQMAEGHYADLKRKPFFPSLVSYFSSGPVLAMVWEGKNVVKTGRVLLGATNPAESVPGTIRGDLCIDVSRNICHGSDSTESAKHEINFWFKPEEISAYDSIQGSWLYEK